MSNTINFNDFQKIEIRTGTIIEARVNKGAHKPAYMLKIDFGRLGEKISSAQLTENYSAEELAGRQVVAVVNFPAKRIAGVKSEVLVLGAMSKEKGVVLLKPDEEVGNGIPIG